MKQLKELKPKHIDAAKLWANNPGWTIKHLAEEVGYSYSAVQTWCDSPIFQDAVNEFARKKFEAAQKKAVAKMIELMEHSDGRVAKSAAEYILNGCNYGPKQQVELSTTDIKINISDDTTELK